MDIWEGNRLQASLPAPLAYVTPLLLLRAHNASTVRSRSMC